jgi:hypothetical protein
VHLQLGSWRDRDRVTRSAAAACVLLVVSACAQPASDGHAGADGDPHLIIRWTQGPVAGRESVGEIQVTDTRAQPVTGAHLRVEGFMSHPGMAPVSATVEEQGGGRYRARVTFTMAGDWVLRLQGAGADGRQIDVQENVRIERPAE